MPCPDKLTPKQCKLRDHIAKKLEGKEGINNPYAAATAQVEKMVARKKDG